jgi:hypothetical protein
MNERIQELAEQCHRTFSEHHIDLDRFAELIVRECMDITKQCSTGKGIHDLFADEIIAEHFGVEE